ncbi:MAG TPA: hypothetical protein VNG89_13335 [Vicinamibacterales bacterium]|nr:hypothetical protein [Vicinamibacterales bacterium]
MTTRTRYFVVASLVVLGVGLSTGLVAYYVGFPARAAMQRGGPEELQYVPRDAAIVGFANVQEIMTSELRQKLHHALPTEPQGQREFQEHTGINLETDIDRVVACARANAGETGMPGAGMLLARGRFDEVRIESLMREHGAQVEDYNGKRLIVGDMARHVDADVDPDAPQRRPRRTESSYSASFLEPGLLAIGSTSMIKTAIDLHRAGNNPQAGVESVIGNEELMNLVRSMDNSSQNAWAVGRFDALRANAHLPENVMNQISAINWFAISGHVNGGLRGTIRAEARDDEAANNLRDVVRGFLALAKLGAGSNPQVQAMMQSLELAGTGRTVSLSFVVPAEVFDIVGAAAQGKFPRPPAH